jgi:hypothetical protein
VHRIVIRNGRSPFEFALVSVSAASGLLGLVLPNPGPSGSIARAFGDYAPVFYALQFAAALVVVLGAAWPRYSVRHLGLGMRIERAGLIPLGGASAAYAAANIVMTGRTAIIAALLIGGIAAAAWIRARIITSDLHKVDELLELEPPSNAPPKAGAHEEEDR